MDRFTLANDIRLLKEFGVWWSGIALQMAILARGRVVGLWKTYPLFYGQVACSLVVALMDLWVFIATPHSFSGVYWDMEFLTALAGCGVLLEVLRRVFVRDGTALIFRTTVQRFVYGAIGFFAVAFAVSRYSHASVVHLVSLERDFRLVQTAILLVVVIAVFYFGLPLGKNLNGMLVGYGIFIACDLVTLALESRFPASFASAWNFLQPFLYCSSLAIYAYALWTYEPGSPPKLLCSVDQGRELEEGNPALPPFGLGNDTISG